MSCWRDLGLSLVRIGQGNTHVSDGKMLGKVFAERSDEPPNAIASGDQAVEKLSGHRMKVAEIDDKLGEIMFV